MAFKRKRIARQQLTGDDASDIEHEVGEPRQARALGIEMPEFEAPPFALVAACLRNALEPEFDAAREREVGGIDGEHEPALEKRLGMTIRAARTPCPRCGPNAW
jgi:hypothetical protein